MEAGRKEHILAERYGAGDPPDDVDSPSADHQPASWSRIRDHSTWSTPPMNLSLSIGPLVALIAGILILIVPRLLNYIVALYLIIIGLLGLFGGNFSLR
jgi:hypothetical protein